LTTVSLEWSHIHFQFKMNKVLCAIFMQQREYINGKVANQLNRETAMAVTDIVTQLTGGDARQTAFEFFQRKFEETIQEIPVDGGNSDMYWNGIKGWHFNIRMFDCGNGDLEVRVHNDSEMYTQCSTDMGFGDRATPDTIVKLAQDTFDFIHDCMKCQVCPMRLARCSDFGICEQCQQQWHEVPCRGCGSQFGSLTDGKHSWC